MVNIISPFFSLPHLILPCLLTTLFIYQYATIISASPSPAPSPAYAPFIPTSPSTPPTAATPPHVTSPLPPPLTSTPSTAAAPHHVTALPPLTSTPPASPPSLLQPLPLNSYNILDALIGAGDFSKWVSILSMMNNPLSTLSLTATLFIPENNAVSLDDFPNINPFVFPYHIVPQRLTFSELLLLKDNARLPTLLPGKSIIITNSSSFNFTVDNVPITHPDIYTTVNVAVHGVSSLLDYSTYGEEIPSLQNPTTTTPPPPSLSPPSVPIGQAITWRSDAACLCSEFPTLILVVCGVMVYKIIPRYVLSC